MDTTSVHYFSADSSIELLGQSICFNHLTSESKIKIKSKDAQKITVKKTAGIKCWLEREGVSSQNSKVILFKRVSKDFKTQENSKNKTLWNIGSTVTIDHWNPKTGECGEGKFHACSRPYFCDGFRSNAGDVYIAIEVSIKDLFFWENATYPHKIAFRSGVVLHQCNKFGDKI
jgi:hypothetical protein